MEKEQKKQERQREQEANNILISHLQIMLDAFTLQTSELEKQKAELVQ